MKKSKSQTLKDVNLCSGICYHPEEQWRCLSQSYLEGHLAIGVEENGVMNWKATGSYCNHGK